MALSTNRPDGTAPDQRRHLVIGFSDLSDSTRILASIEPEIYAEIIDRLGNIFNEIIAKHEGQIIRIDGDGTTFIFDHSRGQEDAGRRATEAAIDLHSGVADLNQELSMPRIALHLHTGIHSGVVLLGAGNIKVGEHRILGDATNTSRRLCDLAGADQIFVSEVTLGADIHFFRIGQQRIINVRGSQKKLAVFEITGRQPTPTRFAARITQGMAPFCGRGEEMRQLRQCLADCAKGTSQHIIVTGNSGIGKTRLLSEFTKHAANESIGVHRGYCEAYLGAAPFQPITQIVRSLLTNEHGLPNDADINTLEKFITKIHGALTRPLMQLLSVNAPGADYVAPSLGDVFPAVLKLVNAAHCDNPLVLCIDDWQWVDGGSKRIIEAIQLHCSRPCLIVMATREYDRLAVSMSGARLIELAPLADEDAKSAIEGLVNIPGPFVVERIINQAGGSPLFIEELCHAIMSDDNDGEQEDRGAWLESLVHSRFLRLSPQQAELVKSASVIGNMIPSWLFEQITGVSLGHPILTSLEEEDFIYKNDISQTLKFKHSFARDAIYQTVGLKQRQAMHNRIVEALHERSQETDEEEELEALSYHYRAGGNAVRAVQYATRAGDKAMAASSLDRAQEFYKAALEQIAFLGSSPDVIVQRNSLVRKFGLACVVDPSWSQLQILKQATDKAAAAKDNEALAWSEYWLGFILYGLGEARRSITHLEAARRAAQSVGDEKQIVQIQATLGQAHAIACEYKPALALLDEAIEIKRNHRTGTHTSIGLSYSLSCKAFVLADQGKFDQAYEIFDQAIDVLAGREHEMTASVLSQRSASHLWQGKFDEAEKYAKRALKVAERVKARYLYAMSRALVATAQWMASQNRQSLETVIETTTWLESVATRQFVSLNYGWLAQGLESIGEFELSRQYAARALLRARKGDRLGEAMTYRALARAANKNQQSELAKKYLKKAHQSAQARGSPHELAKNQVCEVEILVGAGQDKRREDLLIVAAKTFKTLNMDTQI